MKPKYVSPYYDYIKKIHYVESYYHPRTACGLEKAGLKTAPPNEAYSVTCPHCRAYLKSRNSNDEQSVEKTQSESKIPSRETKPKQYALYVVHEWNYYWGLYENGKLIGQDNGWNDLYEFLESNNISWKDVGKTIVLRPSQMKAVNYFPQSLRTLQKKLTVESKSLSPIVAKLIREAEEEEKEEKGSDSLDAQVDKYLSSYESESKSVKTEGLEYGPMARRFLFEDDEEGGGGDEDVDIDTAGDEEPKKLSSEDIDVETFASSVMRMIDNYDTLLEVEHTLLRRASNFLSKNYEPEVVESFKETMRETHGLDVEKTKSETEDEIETPKAAEAGPAGGSGGGGMG